MAEFVPFTAEAEVREKLLRRYWAGGPKIPSLRNSGGLARNRTEVHGFAVRCVTTPPRGLEPGAYNGCRSTTQSLASPFDWTVTVDLAISAGMGNFQTARANMIESQVRTSGITDQRLLAAFSLVAREDFVPEDRRAIAYVDDDL